MTNSHDIWMPIYIGDYLADTMHLSLEEHGAYFMAIMHYWKQGGAIPSSHLKNVLRCSDVTFNVTLAFFKEENGLLYHNRIDEELEKAKEHREKNKNKTKAATAARLANKNVTNNVTNNVTSDVTLTQSQSQSQSPLQSHSKSESKEDFKGDFLFKEKDLGLDFDINNFITPELDMYATETARILNLDYFVLKQKYNALVKCDPPKFPNKAFKAWMDSYTKPIIKKRNTR